MSDQNKDVLTNDRRQIDQVIVDRITSMQEEIMHLHKGHDEQKETINDLNTNIKLIIQKIDDVVICKLTEHEQVLRGDPKAATRNGLVNSVAEIKKDLGTIKWVWGAVWGIIVVVITQVIGVIGKTFFPGR